MRRKTEQARQTGFCLETEVGNRLKAPVGHQLASARARLSTELSPKSSVDDEAAHRASLAGAALRLALTGFFPLTYTANGAFCAKASEFFA